MRDPSMNLLVPLDIPRRASVCFLNGEQLKPGMEIYSLLLENETEQLSRRDYCCDCWIHIKDQFETLKPKGFWKSVIEHDHSLPAVSSRIGKALLLLKQLTRSSESNEEEIFMLCLFLSHARRIALRQEFQKDGLFFQLYEILREEEFITVKALELSQSQIERIQKSLAEKLKT